MNKPRFNAEEAEFQGRLQDAGEDLLAACTIARIALRSLKLQGHPNSLDRVTIESAINLCTKAIEKATTPR